MRVTIAGGKITAAVSMTGLPKVIGSLSEELIAPEEIRWPSGGGLTIQGWLYRAKAPA